MKKFFLHILLVGVLGMLAVSCSDEFDSLSLDSNKAQIVFSVAMDTPVSRSRATGDNNTWGSDYAPSSPGNAYDNHIDLNQFIVKMTDGNGNEYLISDIVKWQLKDDKNENIPNEYKFVGIVEGITKKTTLEDVKIQIYANMGKDKDADFGSMTFQQDAANIPMWGIKSIEGRLTFAPGTRVDFEEISLLRAMAKLEVNLNDEMFNEFALTGAILDKHNSTGFTLPALSEDFDGNTEDLDLEGVLNPLKTEGEQGSLSLVVDKTDRSYVIYLPEVENDDLKITVQLKPKKVDQTGNVTYGDEEEGSFSLLSDVVRNHWYKYTITGFAASQIEVNYNTVPWINVNIPIGGEGFLYLNKDVVEIYNANIDTDQLKFYSSSAIKSITLKDIYKHERNGSFTEGTEDGVYAYYMDKYGVLKQLSDTEGTDEAVVLSKISAATIKVDGKEVLNGGIVINSPFMADNTASESALQGDSHYNTVRYLEFEVENEQKLKATFRVMQYPPVVITNEEGFFSYRDDFRTNEGSIKHQNHNMFPNDIKDNGPIHFQNYHNPAWAFAGYYAYIVTECDAITEEPLSSTYYDSQYKYEEVIYGSWQVAWQKATRYPEAPNAIFHRDHYHYVNGGGAFPSSNNDTEYRNDLYYQALGPLYHENGKNLRRHYTGNLFEFFTPKVVDRVFVEDETIEVEAPQSIYYCRYCTRYENKNAKPYILVENCKYPTSNNHKKQFLTANIAGSGTMSFKKGQAAIYMLTSNDNNDGWDYTSNSYVMNPNLRRMASNYNYFENPSTNLPLKRPSYFNHRMYTIRTSVSTDDYVIGYPSLVDIDGNPVVDNDRGVTADTEANAKIVSPAFMVASQLGETITPASEAHYTALGAEGLLYYAKRHCQEYVETTYDDLNNNYKWDKGEPVKHYRGWRLPTQEELKLILKYQEESPAMDVLLTGKNYFCAKPAPSYVTLNGVEGKEYGFYMRCVRDIKGDENVEIVK